jgi:magnesium transporter
VTTTHEPPSRSEAGWAGPPAPGMRARAWTPAGLVDLPTVAAIREAAADEDARLWVDLTEPDSALLAELATCLDLHELIVEDITERNQRAKIELTDDVLHIVVFALRYAGELLRSEIDVVLGPRFLLTVHDPEWQADGGTVARVGVGRLLAGGPDYLLWAIIDSVVDGYLPVFDEVGDEIDQLQDRVMSDPSQYLVERLFQVKRDLLEIRHAVSPQREILNQLTTRDLPFVRPERIIYFRDIYDHLIRFTDELDTDRELVSTALDAYLSTVNNNLSAVMKRLTAATVILAGVGAVAGVFGMSEAASAFALGIGPGFWVVTGALVVAGFAAFVFFRRIGWI